MKYPYAILMLIFIGFFYQNGLAQYEGYTPSPDNAYWYKYIERGNGAIVDSGLVVEVLVHQYIENPDTIFIDRKFSGPQPALLRNPSADPILRALMGKKVGDSVSIIIPLKGRLRDAMPDYVIGNDAWMRMETRILLVEEEKAHTARKEKEKEMAKAAQLVIDEEKIKVYLKESKLEGFQKDPSGVYYKLKNEGEGRNIQKGASITVHYKGYFLSGEGFDSSYDRGNPFKCVIGVNQVILGWENGLPLFKKGQMGTIIIPSAYAYGERESGTIPANSILIFDIEVIDIVAEELVLDIQPADFSDIKERNRLEITIDSYDALSAAGEPVDLKQLKEVVKTFITNDGKDPASSESSQMAVVSIQTSEQTSYERYDSVKKQLELVYAELRASYLGVSLEKYYEIAQNRHLSENREQYDKAKEKFPMRILDAAQTKD